MYCQKCDKEIDKFQASHKRWCGHKSLKNEFCEKICECGESFVVTAIVKRQKRFCSRLCRDKFTMTSELKSRLSKKRKEYLANNPEKHSWKRTSKKLSKPCEDFKKKLLDNEMKFFEEFTPIKGRFFSLDIAFPEKRIGIEINGNQHYNVDKTLKKYYQDRHDLLESNGWKILEIHYSIVYDDEKLSKIIERIKNDIEIEKCNFDFQVQEKKIKKNKFESKEQRDIARRISSEKLQKYKECILQSNPGTKGWVSRTSKLMKVSHTQVNRIIKRHLKEFIEFLR